MLKKILIVLVLFISLFGCSSKKYTVETVDYLSILPSVNEDESYRVLGFDEQEVFVARDVPVCKMVQRWVTTDNGDTVITEPVDANVCTACAQTIYAIDRDTKEYRILEQGFNNYYVSDFVKLNDKFVYSLVWYEPDTDITTQDIYYDNLDITNQIFDTEYPIVDGMGEVFGPVVLEDVVYYTVIKDNDVYLNAITSEGVTERLVVENVDWQSYSYMYSTPYILTQKDGGTRVYDIQKDSFINIKGTSLAAVISIVDKKLYGYDDEMGFGYIDLQTLETVQMNKQYSCFSSNMVLFEDEIWYLEDNQYRKDKLEYEIKGDITNAMFTKDEVLIETDWLGIEQEMIIIKRK